MSTAAPVESRTAPELPGRMLHARDLAKIIGVSIATIWLWKRTGKLPKPFQPGRKPVWHPDTIAEFLRHGTAKPRVEAVKPGKKRARTTRGGRA